MDLTISELITAQSPKQEYNQPLTHIEACLATLNQAYQDLKTLQCFKDYPQIEPSLLNAQPLVQRACQGQAPLKLLLLGGTGVGKSSLINHLAHKKVSSTSNSLRAHTQGFVIYLHDRWKAQVEQQAEQQDEQQVEQQDEQQDSSNLFWPKELHPFTHYAYHQINDLHDLWLIDAPDIDSIIAQHPQRVRQALQETDLPLWVCSPQNYRDQSNVSFLNLINQHRTLIAILNQADYLSSVEQDEVLNDAQSFIADLGFQDVQWFMTACNDPKLSEYPQGNDPPSPPNSYQLSQLKTHLEQEFDHKEQARLKRLSLAQRLQETYHLLHEPLIAVALIKVKKAWYSEQLTKLKPIFRQALALGIQKDLNQYIQNIYCSSSSPNSHALSSTLISTLTSTLWSFYLLFFPKSPQLEQNLYDAIMKLKVEEIRLNSSKDRVGFNLKLSSMSLQTLLEQAQNELHLSDKSFKNKLYQLTHTAIRNSLMKSVTCLLACFLLILALKLSMNLSFISLSLVIIVLIMSFEALRLSNDIQQESQVFLNQKQVELSQSSHKYINSYLRQDPLFSQAISEADLLFEERKNTSNSTSQYRKIRDLNREKLESLNQQMFEQNQKMMMLTLYKESLQSLQKYTYALYGSS